MAELMTLGSYLFYFIYFLAMPVEIIPFSQIMRLYLKSEFIVSSLNACHVSLHPTQLVNTQ